MFRDLWTNEDNIGLYIKDKSINNYIEECVNKIIEKIKGKNINCIQIVSNK